MAPQLNLLNPLWSHKKQLMNLMLNMMNKKTKLLSLQKFKLMEAGNNNDNEVEGDDEYDDDDDDDDDDPPTEEEFKRRQFVKTNQIFLKFITCMILNLLLVILWIQLVGHIICHWQMVKLHSD